MQPDRFARSTPSGSRLGLVRPGLPGGVAPSPPVGTSDPGRGVDPVAEESAPGARLAGERLDAFAAGASLRLAGTLNLRRTLGLTLSLAVPQLADWASIELQDGSEVRGASLREGRPGEQWSGRDAAQAVLLGAITELGEQGAAPTVLQLPLRVRGRELGRLTMLRGAEASGEEQTVRAFAGELADRAALALDAARVYEERTTLATTLRDSLRPDDLPRPLQVRLGARYRPAEEATEIGGDFYDVYRGPRDQWWFAVGDVCGKGVDAAVLTGRVRSGLHMAALAGREPDVVLDLLNEVMLLEGGTEFVTLVVGRLEVTEPGAVELRMSGGGHLPPLVLRADGSVEPVATGGVLVGMLPEARFRTSDVRLGPGEVCLFYTDGVTEATDRSGTMFGPERLERLLADCRGMPPQAVAERVEQNVLEHLGGRPHDDIAVFAIGPDDAAAGGTVGRPGSG